VSRPLGKEKSHEEYPDLSIPHDLEKSQPEEFDIALLGGGTRATLAAWTFAGEGKRVAIIDRKYSVMVSRPVFTNAFLVIWPYNALRADVGHRRRGFITLPRVADYSAEWILEPMCVFMFLIGPDLPKADFGQPRSKRWLHERCIVIFRLIVRTLPPAAH
jgi:hypothetical protein